MVAVPSKGRADLQAHAPEADAARVLFEKFGRQIYAYCYSRLRSPEEAEDAVQSTFLNAFRALQRDVAPKHEAAWLYKIAENVCLTRARSSVRRRRVETPGDLEAISEIVPAHEPDAEELVNLPQALESMPEQQRRALLLREWQGLSYREIAEEMELSQSAVETLLFRARRALASGLVEEPKRRGPLARLRASGDAGAVAALLKTVLFSGGGKAVIAGAVAASGVLGVSPGARHTIDDLFVPHLQAAPVHHVVVARPKAVHTHAPVVVAPVVVHHVAPPVAHATPKQKAKPHIVVAQRHERAKVHHAGRLVRHPDPQLPPPAAPAATTGKETPVAPLTQTPAEPAAKAPAPEAKHRGKAQHDQQPSRHAQQPPRHEQEPAQPAPNPAPPAPVVPPVVPAPSPAPADPGQGNNGNGDTGKNGNGNDGQSHVRGQK